MKKLLLVAIFMVIGTANAQITLTGVVKDSIGNPLEMSNVLALNKSTNKMESYGFTDASGRYKLSLSKNTTFAIKISYVGYITAEFDVDVKEEKLTKNVTLKEDNSLDEVNITYKMPVTIKGDTIVYNADSFKNGSERKLEDVLEKLPGVEVNDDGEIEVEGKVVEKIMVDGKEFFSGDTKLASKNIPSNAVDKIQVLRNYSNVNQLSGVQNNQDRVAINIKLKEGKKNFWFGDVLAGGGSAPNEGLYLFQPKLFYYTPKYTLNVIGDLNNLGEVVLDRRSLRSFGNNFRSQSPSNGTNIDISDAGIGFLNASARNANRIETKLAALNFSYSPNSKLDLSGFLIWSGNSNGQRNINTIDYLDPDTPDDTVDNSTSQTSNSGLFKLSAGYKKNANNQLNYNISGRFTNEYKTEDVNSFVLSDIAEKEDATPFTINQDFSYFYTASEKNIFALEVKHLLQDEDPFYAASLENDPNNNDDANNDGFDDTAESLGLDRTNMFYDLNQERRVKSNQLDAKLDYYYILNDKSNLNVVAGTILSTQNFNSRFFQTLDNGTEFTPDPTIDGIDNPITTNDTEYNFTDIYAGLRYRLKSGIFTFTPGFTLHSYSSENTQFGNEFFKDEFVSLLPEFEMITQFKKSESLTLSYKKEINFTDVNQIARGIVANNYNSYFAGNADLVNSSFHNLSLFYRSFNLFNNSSVFARVNYRKTADQVNNNTIFEPGSVVSSSTTINSPFSNESLSSSVSASKTIRKLQFRIGGNFSYNKSYQFINSLENVSKIYNTGLNTRIGTNFREAPNVSLNYRVSFSDQENSSREGTIKSVTHAPSINFDAYIWDSVTLTSDYSFTDVRQNGASTNTFDIWNAKLAYRKDKDAKWEYEIVGNNLLGTGSQTSVSQSILSFNINERFILPRFISFRVRYQL
ncbi:MULTISPECIES: carboxypeptidase-like regulatory domain-containing protein [Tenacibaculum]|uniref:carboxypeptidase-like regulatory domain-containing protein n=1 Tax=Tenacibaculum TaxID=104267 RepID=UPI001F0A334A|nr:MULTISPECIES: carboxypeptidase-like regulatory domain-containing protein [Tenacibaculum]MCH3881783.1 carboxypeptidase-like regulatory domain-containing protein [Tenacibaculum aquimarinum]MDO6598649.1 carboxypeptidase-like regulatory domain-containing protein [Tenacibaculum sp. 1_MG-2023]